MIGIINYGSGNVQAIANIYKRLNIPFLITSEPTVLFTVNKLILPGVGAFDETMKLLHRSNLVAILNELVLVKQIPILGICVGMQIMAHDSEEGRLSGLSWIDASVKKINTNKLKHKPYLPHMGWNEVFPTTNNPLFDEINPKQGFYFLHSYYFACKNQSNVLAHTCYGEAFPSAVNDKNIYGVQFHPEKSHANGILVLKNFADLPLC